MAGLQPTLSQLRPALQLALEVAAAAPGPLPGRVRNLVRSRRLPGSWPVTIRQVLEEEEPFRQLVSAEADEKDLGPLAWLWLTRPDGWEDQVDDLLETSLDTEEQERDARLAAERIAGLEAELTGARADARAASEASSALERELAEWRRQVTRLEEQLRSARAEAERAADEARQAVERAADEARQAAERARSLEADNVRQARRLAALHAELDRTEGARRQARADAEAAAAGRSAAEADRLRVEAGEQGLRRAVGPAVGRAAAAARELGEALAEASRLLAGGPGGPQPVPGPRTPLGAGRPAPPARPAPAAPPVPPLRPGPQPAPVPATRPGPGRADPLGGRDRPRRRPLPLPPAVFDDSPEAAAHLVRAAGVHLVVDGYNVTFTSWTGNDLPALRHRLVTALSELVVRVKLPVTVVFDGADEGGRVAAPPVARPWLRIVFSASSVEADEVIVEAVRALPAQVPVVVVTNDRRVRADVGRLGANVLSVEQFLGVLGRQPGGAPGA